MSVVRIPFVIVLLSLLAAACSGDSAKSTPTPTLTPQAAAPSASSQASATAAPAGPSRLAVYGAVGRVRFDFTKVVVWDLGANRLASSFEFGDKDDRATGAALAGRDIVYATSRRVTRAGLTGANARQIFAAPDGTPIQDIGVSPDGKLLAVAVGSGNPSEPGELRIVDLVSAQERAVVKQSDPRFAAMHGQFWQLQWRADSSGVLVQTATYTEAWGALATVFVDGRVRVEQADGYGNVSPTGTLRAGVVGNIQCMFIASHEMVIRNLDDGSTPLHASADNTLYTPWEWSPDGTEFVWLQQPAGACEELSLTKQVMWLVKTTDGKSFGAPERVPDLQALHQRWYGDDLFSLDCPAPVQPVLSRMGDMLITCSSDPFDVVRKVLVGGRPAGEGQVIYPLGVIER